MEEMLGAKYCHQSSEWRWNFRWSVRRDHWEFMGCWNRCSSHNLHGKLGRGFWRKISQWSQPRRVVYTKWNHPSWKFERQFPPCRIWWGVQGSSWSAKNSSNAVHTNGFLLLSKAIEMVHRGEVIQRQELVDALRTIVSKGFYTRFMWDDWVQIVASILHSLESMNWLESVLAIIEGLIAWIGLDIINVQMHQNLSDPDTCARASESFLGLISWVDSGRDRMTLPAFKSPENPIASSVPIPIANEHLINISIIEYLNNWIIEYLKLNSTRIMTISASWQISIGV